MAASELQSDIQTEFLECSSDEESPIGSLQNDPIEQQAIPEANDICPWITFGNVWNHFDRVLEPNSLAVGLTDIDSRMWIQVRIVNFHARDGSRGGKYTVRDADVEAEQQQKTWTLDAGKIIPLPTLSDLSLSERYIFGRGTRVLALFEGTTTFYLAEIITVNHSKNSYWLKFQDDEIEMRLVSAEFVCPIPIQWQHMFEKDIIR